MKPADERLVAALTAEHAAVYGYGVLGPKLDSTTIALARAADNAHRTRRDALLVRLTSDGITPPPTAPSYQLPFAVTDRASALKLAVQLEDRTAAQWRLALPATDGDLRKTVLDALVDCTTRAVAFRKAGSLTPLVAAFPGKTV
ncbi:ferritin-like domain-containing protein [Dactylosporangium vinaceum]|uniref:Ferritin-like domain-containing protein n=1 Tax=Dactylosporangium vinaceum TaxID=53362 RepID=A0ABV5M0C7_9ACTN|nr:ferritin-like domain-containing protein [Dactylosporangium vinaceum]UAB98131.1 ferritin-like domain-containing protein [Dactylosporangium vinaceum]